MAAKTVPPTRDQELALFADNASGIITTAPTAVGLSSSQATTLAGLTSDYLARLNAATEPVTRTSVTVAAKNTSRESLRSTLRQYLRIIDSFPGTTDAQREALGMNLPSDGGTPIPAPTTQPIVAIAGTGGGKAVIRLRDQTAPDRRAKPALVFGALIATAVTEPGAPAPAFDDGTFNVVVTRTTHTLTLPPGSAAKVLWVQAWWTNERGMPGPAGLPVSAVIAA